MNERTKRDINNLLRLPRKVALNKLFDKILKNDKSKKQKQSDDHNTTYININDQKLILNSILNININEIEKFKDDILLWAVLILEHKFDLLGSGITHVYHGAEYSGLLGYQFKPVVKSNLKIDSLINELINTSNLKESLKISKYLPEEYIPIDWQVDFKSGYRWNEKTYFRDIKYGKNDGADIKVPWELGRMQYLYILIFAFVLTQNQKYITEFKNQILDFIAFNPPRFGSQWTTCMDVSIRAVNWIFCYDLIQKFNISLNENFDNIFQNSIITHLDHISANLEWSSGMRGNHYFASICSMIILCIYLPDYKNSDKYLRFALNELYNEILFQFLHDGGNFEASTSYHRFAAEMLFYTLNYLKFLPSDRILKISKFNKTIILSGKQSKVDNSLLFSSDNKLIKFDVSVNERLSNIAEFSLNVLSFKAPLIGDDDSGYFINLNPNFNVKSNKELKLDINNPQLLFSLIDSYFGYSNENGVLTGFENINKNKRNQDSKFFKAENFGLIGFKNPLFNLILRTGGIGQNGKGGHAHNDAASIILNVENNPILVDPGTFLYTALFEERNKFRSTNLHNVIQVNNIEQNDFYNIDKNDLFWLKNDKAKCKLIEYNDDYALVEHYAYGLPCSRELKLNDKNIRIEDICFVKGEKSIFLHLYPGLKIKKSNNEILIDLQELDILIKFPEIGDLSFEKYNYSPAYGVIIPAKKIVFKTEQNEIVYNINFVKKIIE